MYVYIIISNVFNFLSIYSQNQRYFFLHYVFIYLNKNYFYRALLNKIKKLKRINLLAQKLKRTHRQLTGRGLKKAHMNDISIKTRQNVETDLYKVSTY